MIGKVVCVREAVRAARARCVWSLCWRDGRACPCPEAVRVHAPRYENGTTLRIARKGRGAAERLRHVRSRATPFDRRPILPRLVHCLYFPNVKKQRGSMLGKSIAPLMKRMKSIARKMIFAATHTVLRECAPLQRQWLRRRRHLRPRPKHCEASIPVGSFQTSCQKTVTAAVGALATAARAICDGTCFFELWSRARSRAHASLCHATLQLIDS